MLNKAAAKLPNKITRNVSFFDLTPLALKVFLFAVYMREGKAGSMVRMTWYQLEQAVHPDGLKPDYDYRHFHAALDQLMRVKVTYTHKKATSRGVVRESYNLLAGWKHDTDASELTIWFNDRLNRLLDLLLQEARDFTLLPLSEVMKVESARQIRLLMWAAQMSKLHSETQRTIPVEDLVHALNFDPSFYYSSWSRVRDEVSKHLKHLAKRTSYKMTMHPLRTGRAVTHVRFDVERR